jgi:hypothetical protein
MPVMHDEVLAPAGMLRWLLAVIEARELSCSTG